MNWERAIIIGNTKDTYFVASSHDELILRKNNSNICLSIGDCIKMLSNSRTCWVMGGGMTEQRRVVDKFEKIDRFVELKIQNQNRGVYIMANILNVDYRPHPRSNELVRCFRTDFLEKVYDDNESKTRIPNDQEFVGSKVIARHMVNPTKHGYWAVINVNNNPNDSFDRTGRIFRRGIALDVTERENKNGKHDIHFWIPHVRDRALYTEELRGNIPKRRFLGNWVSFSLNSRHRLDESSNITFISDVLPTRIFLNRCEVRVSVRFDMETWNRKGYPELGCEQCGGLVADITNTLEKYGMLKSFSGEAWVQYFQHEPSRGIWFILSEKQDEWIDDNQIDRPRKKEQFFKQDRHDYLNDNSNAGDSSRRRYQSRSPETSNYRDTFDSKKENDSDDSWDQEDDRISRMRESSRPPMKNEKERSPQKSNYRDSFDYKNSERDQDYRRRERSRPREDFDIVDERNREYERISRLRESSRPPMKNENEREKSRPSSRVDRSPSRKRDDTSSIPSTSRSYDNLGKAQTNLKKLKTKYEYLTENDMPIPETLIEDLKNAMLDEQISNKRTSGNFDDIDSRKSESRCRSSKVEVDEREFKKYKELVILFRGMLSSPKVREEMRRYDENLMNNINRLIFDS